MTRTSVYIRKAAPLLLAALFVCAGPADAQQKKSVAWGSPKYTGLQPNAQPEPVPEYFWFYIQNELKTSPVAWKNKTYVEQQKMIERDVSDKASEKAGDLFVETNKRLEEAVKNARAASDPDAAIEIVDAAEKDTKVEYKAVKRSLGTHFSKQLDAHIQDLKDIRGKAQSAKAKKQSERMQKEGSLKDAKKIESMQKAGLDEKSKELGKMYGERGGADGPKDGKDSGGKAQVGDMEAGSGQLKNASGAESKYGKSNSKIQQSLFSVAAPPGAPREGIVFRGYAAPSVKPEDRAMLASDFKMLEQLPSGKALLDSGVRDAGMRPLRDDEGLGDDTVSRVRRRNVALEEAKAAGGTDAQIDAAGYTQARSGRVYFAASGMPSKAAGVTYYDPDDKKTLIALSPDLKNADEGVRLAVLTDELSHVQQQQVRAIRGQQPLMPSRELEKSARLQALQVYGEYYEKTGKPRPYETDLDKKLSDQYDMMTQRRRGDLMQDLDIEYKYAPTTNKKSLGEVRVEESRRLINIIPSKFDATDRLGDDTQRYYDEVVRNNTDWVRSRQQR